MVSQRRVPYEMHKRPRKDIECIDMADPKTKDGHIDIANEIADRFCSYRLNGQEWQIIWVILRKTWGWLSDPKDKNSPKKKMDRIALSQFAKLTGINRSRCHSLLKGLIEKNIVKKSVTQKCNTLHISYGIQSDYDKWMVLPKSTTVTQKCNRVLPKSATRVLPKSATTKDTITKDIITKDIIYILVFKKWNEQKIIVHKKITPKIKSSINSALKEFSREEILQAFENYKTVLSGAEYYFTYKWTLEDFLKRGLRKFVDEADPFNNFKSKKRGSNGTSNEQPGIAASFAETEYNNIVGSWEESD